MTPTPSTRALLATAGLFGLLALAAPAPANAQGEGAHVAPSAASLPSWRLPGWNAALGNSFRYNAGEGGDSSTAVRPGGVPGIDGHTRQVGEQFRVNSGDKGG
jgi:hypothetical protein